MNEQPLRGRGRPKGGGIIDRQDIIDAALDALANGGYASLSMRGVARSLDVSLGAVQHHFATKDALWKASTDDFSASLQRYASDAASPDLTSAIENLLEQGSTRPGLMAALLSDRAPGSAERISYLAERLIEQFTKSQELIESRSARGNLRPIDARAFLMVLGIGVGSIAGAAEATHTLYGYNLNDPGERGALAHALADILSFGVLPR
jgi:AcrR family transcriptional regulator